MPGPPLSCNEVYCWDEAWRRGGDQVIPQNRLDVQGDGSRSFDARNRQLQLSMWHPST